MAKAIDTERFQAARDIVSARIDALDQEREQLLAAFVALGGEIEEDEAEAEKPKLLEGPKKGKRKAKAGHGDNSARVAVEFEGHTLKMTPACEKLLDALELAGDGGITFSQANDCLSNAPNFNYGLGRLRKMLRPAGWQIETLSDGYRLVKG